jgi:prevent-host-death family protein
VNEVGAYEAKTRLPELLRRVEAGERFRITRNGHPVAELAPAAPERPAPIDAIVSELRGFSQGRVLGGEVTLRELIDEGRVGGRHGGEPP